MFESTQNSYNNIISEIGIVGYLEEDIIKRGYDTETNLPLNLLYRYPKKESNELGSLIFQMMFPNDEHKIQTPKFFSLTLTNEQASRSFLYCLKFPEKYILNPEENEEQDKNEIKINESNNNQKPKYIEVPLVIYLKSAKEDLEPFKQLLYSINQVIVNDNYEKQGFESNYVNNYKKVQLMNLLHFILALPHTSPHSLVKLQLAKELDNIINVNAGINKNETIDFYFSSNCEIPCNKNDTDINILFLILDQSIIIKVLFSILTEKQIIFTASQAYLLHLIISTFLKLIFPFKWHHSCITVVPKENLDVLEIPGSYIFGILSSILTAKDLIDEYPGKIIVDCDTNEIFGYSNLEPFEPPEIHKKEKSEDKKKKEKDKKKDKELFISNLDSENLAQGKNLIIIDKNLVLKYKHEIHGKKQKLIFDSDNNIIIDAQQSKLFIDKNDIFLDSSDWKWLRRNIQLVRNPEIFNLDNIQYMNKKYTNKHLLNDDDNPILPNRPFSYNIQNIILTFILKKLAYSESDFMSVFKKTNLYLEYKDNSKEFENTKGNKIIKNIEETKNEPRSIENCFNIEYILNPFNVQNIIDKIDFKLNEKEKNKDIIPFLKKLKKPFVDYFRLKEEIINGNTENESIYYSGRKPSISEFRKTGGSIIKNKITKNLFGHVKNNTSLLQETSGHNKYILFGIDKEVKDTFQFYTKNGFICFLQQFEQFLKDENLNIRNVVYNDIIKKQIVDLVNKCFTKKENGTGENNDLLDLDKKNLRKALGVSIVPEKNEEEMLENEAKDRDSQGSVKIKKEEEYDFAENLMNGIKKENYEIQKLPGIYDELGLIDDNNIINFQSFDFDKERKKFENENKNEVNLLMQYYLFLAYYLEESKKDESTLNYILKNISIEKEGVNIENNNENADKNNINELIIKLYKLAYSYSDKKHRDYPYYSFYNFINEINSEELKSFNDIFNLLEEEDELSQIYQKVIFEKQQVELKKLQKMEMMSFRNNTSGNITRTSTNYKNSANNNSNITNKNVPDNLLRKSEIIKNKIIPSKIINLFSLMHKKQSNQPNNRPLLEIRNDNNNTEDFNLNYLYIINSSSEFNSSNDDHITPLIINDISELLIKEFPKENDLIDKNINEILEETSNKIKENKELFKLIGQLKYLKLDSINSKEKCLAFWLNCFNYLILFVIFYRKWNINGEKKWKKFFRNIKFEIGGKCFSFSDMQYIIFKKPSFFSSTYKPSEEIRKLSIEKIAGDKKSDDYFKLTPFLLFLPIKKFLAPSLYDNANFEEQVNQRINRYINQFIYIDDKNHLCCSELLLKYDNNIFGKGIKKYESFFKKEIYNSIKDKKYKKINIQKISWNLNFDYLIINDQDNKEKIE